MRRKTFGTSFELHIRSIRYHPSLLTITFSKTVSPKKFFHFGASAGAVIITSTLLVEDPSCIGVEHSAGSGTVFITRHTWFNRLKAIVSSGSWRQFQPAPHFRISYVGASSQAAI